MNDKAVHYLDLANEIDGDDDSMPMPFGVRVLLDEVSVDLLDRARKAFVVAKQIYEEGRPAGGDIAPVVQFGFSHLQYVQDDGQDGSPWVGAFTIPRTIVTGLGVEFKAFVENTNITLCSEQVSYERLDKAVRRWRAEVMGLSIEDAMVEQDAPAPRKSSGMAPI